MGSVILRDKTPPQHNYIAKWDFTKATDPLVDEVNGLTATLLYGATINNSGISTDSTGEQVYLGNIDMMGKTIEVDFGTVSRSTLPTGIPIIINSGKLNDVNARKSGSLLYHKTNGFSVRSWDSSSAVNPSTGISYKSYNVSNLSLNDISNKTVKIIYVNDSTQEFYINDEYISSINNSYLNNYGGNHTCKYLYIGGFGVSDDDGYNLEIKAVRIYENEE